MENNNNNINNDIADIEKAAPKKKQNLVLATIGLILGIISIPLICVWFIGILTGAIGVILCLLSRPKDCEEQYSAIASAGIVIGILAVVGGLFFLILSWASMKMSL